ncbi:hypothetical protein Glove_91g13 [Diversispora epigaea]|uniref:Uncharacterized protein n=1 Tax=Diversispora epigaea TaxID=1348612 RepID=A0A397J9X1_9GLOM|nr:hypothetical protein Glove_91g13 [Diversispora epigaea]
MKSNLQALEENLLKNGFNRALDLSGRALESLLRPSPIKTSKYLTFDSSVDFNVYHSSGKGKWDHSLN